MAIRPILKYSAPELRQVCPPFDWSNPEHEAGLRDLRDTLEDAQGGAALGLAANQIGLMARAFAIRIGGQIVVMTNPRVVSSSATVAIEEERCLSFPNLSAKVARPESGLVSWNEDGTPGMDIFLNLGGWEFRCFLHELDHLNGITLDILRRKAK